MQHIEYLLFFVSQSFTSNDFDFTPLFFCFSNREEHKIASRSEVMEIVTLQAHFDGTQILLDEPYELTTDTKLVVSVIEAKNGEREDWTRFSLANLERAYGSHEPEYSLDQIKEPNPSYEGR